MTHSGDDAKWVEDPLVPRQHTLPGQRSEQDGVEADAHETDGSSQVVKEGQVMWLRRTVGRFKMNRWLQSGQRNTNSCLTGMWRWILFQQRVLITVIFNLKSIQIV